MRALTAPQADGIRSAAARASRRSGLHFAVYVGPLTGPRRDFAERLHAALGATSDRAVLILVDSSGRALEIVTGREARRRLADGDCRAIARAIATACGTGDLPGGLMGGLAALSERARVR